MAADGGPLRDQQLPLEELDPHPIISDAKPHICWEKVNEDIWNDIKPIYEDLNQQRLSTEQAEEAFVSSLVSHLFKHGALKTKLPRTNQNTRTRTQSDPKTVQRLKLAKNSARKNLHRDPSTFLTPYAYTTKSSDNKRGSLHKGTYSQRRRNSEPTASTLLEQSVKGKIRTTPHSVPVSVTPTSQTSSPMPIVHTHVYLHGLWTSCQSV